MPAAPARSAAASRWTAPGERRPAPDEALTAWAVIKAEHMGFLLTDATAHAIAIVADTAVRSLAADRQRLLAELDGYRGHQVFHALDRDLDGLAGDPAVLADAVPGAILRATDTGRELRLGGDGAWV